MTKLLFVEDDILTGVVYRNHLTSLGFEVELVGDGERAVKALERFKPDLVVLDLVLPKFNGLEILKRIRARPETKALPVLVFSNALSGEITREAVQAGATACLPKSATDLEGLLSAIRSALRPARGTEGTVLGSVGPAAAPPPPSSIYSRQVFLTGTPHTLAELRRLSQELLSPKTGIDLPATVLDLERKAHALTATSALAGVRTLSIMASALDLLLKELYENPGNINASTTRTVNQSVDCLQVLCELAASTACDESVPFRILVVDDDAVALAAITAALARAELDRVSVEDPFKACELLQRESFNLLITEAQLPRMSGFELCQKMRSLPGYARTPVIFVTALSDFTTRVRSAQSGGVDLIAKPFLAVELAVKALIHLLSHRTPTTARLFQPFGPKS